MKQTAVEWLVEQLESNIMWTDKAREAVEQAKKMEKEQHQETFNNGFITTDWDKIKENKAEKYYNETFKSE